MMSEVLNFFTELGVPQTLIILGLSVAGAFAYGKKWQYSVDKGALEAAKSALEAAEQRRQLAEDQLKQTSGETKTIADHQARIAELEMAVASKASLSVIEPLLNQLKSDTGELATANLTTVQNLRFLSEALPTRVVGTDAAGRPFAKDVLVGLMPSNTPNAPNRSNDLNTKIEAQKPFSSTTRSE